MNHFAQIKMANPINNGYHYVGPFYSGSEEGSVGGNTGNGDYQPPNPSDLNANLQISHHSMQAENGFQPAHWFSSGMQMGQFFPRPPSQESTYNGHGPYMSPYSPQETAAVQASINMPAMMGPQPPHSPSPSAIANGHGHHSPPYYNNHYLGLGSVTGTPEGVPGCPADVDPRNHNLSSDSAHMAMQALSLNSARVPAEDNGLQHDGRSPEDWSGIKRFQAAELHSGNVEAAAGVVEGIEIKQEVSEQPWRTVELAPRTNSRSSSSGNSPLREENEVRENNWKAAGKTRTKDKYRVVYSDQQRVELEREFHYGRYITIRRKAELASQLGLSERQVKIWFQNRRAKEKRQMKKLLEEQCIERAAQPHNSVPIPTHTYPVNGNELNHVYGPIHYPQQQAAHLQVVPHQYPTFDPSRYPSNFQNMHTPSPKTSPNSPYLGSEETSKPIYVNNFNFSGNLHPPLSEQIHHVSSTVVDQGQKSPEAQRLQRPRYAPY